MYRFNAHSEGPDEKILYADKPDCGILADQCPIEPSEQATDVNATANHLVTISEQKAINSILKVIQILRSDTFRADLFRNRRTNWNICMPIVD